MSRFAPRARRSSPLLVLAGLFVCACSRAQSEAPPGAPDKLAELARTCQIELVTANPSFPVKTMHATIDGSGAGSKELESYAGLFVREFTLYPPDLVKRSRLKRVVFCRELSLAGERRNAIPDWDHDTLYVDVSRGAYSRPYLCKVIHHEFFHIIDYRDDGSVYRDERWASLNAPDFRYGSGGRAAQDQPRTSALTDEFPGFLNHYSTTAIEEDKAEVFANLIVEPSYVEGRARKDSVLRAKTERMKGLLSSFCPDMNDEFWTRVRGMERTNE